MAENFNSRTQRGTSYFDSTTFVYLWKNSEVDPNNQDIKCLYDDIKADMQGNGQFTTGSLFFAGSTGIISEDNANLFWDDTLNRLGIGLNTGIDAKLQVRGEGLTASTSTFLLQNSLGQRTLEVDDLGQTFFGTFGSRITTSAGAKAVLVNFSLINPTFFTPINLGGQNLTNANNFSVGTALGAGGASSTINILNDGNPSAGLANNALLYCNDVVAGNAALFTRTELGDIIKLYAASGWDTATGTATRTTFDTSTVTTQQLAERLKALIDDLYTGNIGMLTF